MMFWVKFKLYSSVSMRNGLSNEAVLSLLDRILYLPSFIILHFLVLYFLLLYEVDSELVWLYKINWGPRKI